MSSNEVIVIPFQPRFHALIRQGIKTATSRNGKYGEPGDILEGPSCLLRLTRVTRLTLEEVARDHWDQEGVSSPDEFIHIWNQIHPMKSFVPTQTVWFHEFDVVRE